MTSLLKFLSIFAAFFMETTLLAYEFKSFQVEGELKRKVLKQKGLLRGTRSEKNNFDFDDSPLIQELEGILLGEYENIGKTQTDKLLKNYDLGGGVLNFSGFTWHKPMLNYDVQVNREVAPDLMSGKWIVHDSFTILIEAATLLSNLQKQKQLSISDVSLGAFAGVYLKRTYHYNHFAGSYEEGLIADFSKLFLAFRNFNLKGINKIEDYEVLKRKDEYSFNAGGIVKAPIGSYLGVQAGALIKRSYTSEVLMQKSGPEDSGIPGELRVNVENETSKSTEAQLQLQADFFNLLKLTLLEYELEYEFGRSQKTYFTFSKTDLDSLGQTHLANKEFKRILRGKQDVNLLKANIVGHERRTFENRNSKFSFLLFGSMKKRASEQINIIKDGIEKTFFKHYSRSVKYVESLFSRLFSSAIFKIFNFSSNTKKRMETQKELNMEYEKVEDLAPTIVDSTEKFSLRFTYNSFIENTHKWYHYNYRKTAMRSIERYTSLSSEYVKRVKKKKLRGPIEINSKVEVGLNALNYFHDRTTDELVRSFMSVCKVKSKYYSRYKNEKKRRRYLRGRLDSKKKCLRKIISRHKSYISEVHNTGHYNLFKFKKFFGQYLSKLINIGQLKSLFGSENLFIYGEFKARTKDGKNFQTFFKSGQFSGLGVIDTFKNNKQVSPIEVSNE